MCPCRLTLRRGLLAALAALPLLAPASARGAVECGANLSAEDRAHCESLLLDAADAELNRVYRQAMADLDTHGAEMLRAAQRAWLAYRDGNFESFAAADPGQGQAGLAERVRDLRLLTTARTRELERLRALAAAAAGPGHGGPVPDQAPPDFAVPTPRRALPDPPAPNAPGAPDPGQPEPGDGPAPWPPVPLPPGDDPAPVPPPAPAPPAPPQAVAPEAPAIPVDGPDASVLLGRHDLRLQWLSSVPSGTAEIVERDGALWLAGQQGQGANMLLVEGHVVAVDADGFVLRGRVVTRVDFLGGGQSCERRGDLFFARKAGRPFWRLQAIDNPCTGVSDYVDIAVEPAP